MNISLVSYKKLKCNDFTFLNKDLNLTQNAIFLILTLKERKHDS